MASRMQNLTQKIGRQVAKTLQSKGNMMGWLGQKSMERNRNKEMARQLVRLSQIKPEATIVELGGRGSDHVLDELFQTKNPSRVYGIENSWERREQLETKFQDELDPQDGRNVRLSLHDDDPVRMSFIEDASVDCIYGMNTSHFLDQTSVSHNMTEMHRILKPGGTIIWSVTNHHNSFGADIVTNWNKCIQAMEDANFTNVTMDETDAHVFPHPIFIKANKNL